MIVIVFSDAVFMSLASISAFRVWSTATSTSRSAALAASWLRDMDLSVWPLSDSNCRAVMEADAAGRTALPLKGQGSAFNPVAPDISTLDDF